jgi:hypothetical protein
VGSLRAPRVRGCDRRGCLPLRPAHGAHRGRARSAGTRRRALPARGVCRGRAGRAPAVRHRSSPPALGRGEPDVPPIGRGLCLAGWLAGRCGRGGDRRVSIGSGVRPPGRRVASRPVPRCGRGASRLLPHGLLSRCADRAALGCRVSSRLASRAGVGSRSRGPSHAALRGGRGARPRPPRDLVAPLESKRPRVASLARGVRRLEALHRRHAGRPGALRGPVAEPVDRTGGPFTPCGRFAAPGAGAVSRRECEDAPGCILVERAPSSSRHGVAS